MSDRCQATLVGMNPPTTLKGKPMNHYKIWLDGGSKRNGDREAFGYGSYYFQNMDKNKATVKRLEFGAGTTNNEAEWKTLITVLKVLTDANDAEVSLFMDSKLVVNQFNKRWQCKDERMAEFRDKALKINKKLKKNKVDVNLSWLPRDNIEIILGH